MTALAPTTPRSRAAARAAHAAHLEQIGEVAGEGERQLHVERAVAVVLEAQALIGGAAPQKKRAHDVQRVFRQHQLAGRGRCPDWSDRR